MADLPKHPMAELPKLDAKFEGEVRKVKDGSVVADDEYIVFLAKDDAFAAMFLDRSHGYLSWCIRLGADEEQILAVERMMERMVYWREVNADRCKTPDAQGEKLLDVNARDDVRGTE